MNFLHHRQKSRGHVLSMPEGLEELMGDISREVLRWQPSLDCTYKFIADYLEVMANTRDKCKIAMEVIKEAILKTDEAYSPFSKCIIPKDKTNSFLNMMEIIFRRFVDQKRQRSQDPRFIKFHADDVLDELVRKCGLTKVEVLRSRLAIQWAYRKFVKTYLAAIEGTLDTEDLHLKTEKYLASIKELDKMHRSAVQIQKVFRGYQARKSLQEKSKLQFKEHQLSEDSKSSSSFMDFILERQEQMTAAIKIQASFKGFYVRKKNVLDKKKVSLKLYNPIMVDRRSCTTIKSSFPHPESEEQITKKLNSPPVEESIKILFQEVDSSKIVDISNNKLREAQEILELSNNDPQDLNEAAVKIQATFKGYRVRKEMSTKQRNSKTLQE